MANMRHSSSFEEKNLRDQLQKLNNELANSADEQARQAAQQAEDRIESLKNLYRLESDLIEQTKTKKLKAEQEINAKLRKQGYSAEKIAKALEYKLDLDNFKKLSKEEQKIKKAAFEAELKDRYKADVKELDQIAKYKDKQQKQAIAKEKADQAREKREAKQRGIKDLQNGVFGKGLTIGERFNNLKQANGVEILGALADYTAQLNKQIDSIAGRKGIIDTAMQGSRHATGGGLLGLGSSYWDNMSDNIIGLAGMSPFVKQESIANNLQNMITSGINFNVEQRAFLATIKDKIAATFNAQDATLLRLIRIQQQDSTAARLGMESSMTAFLNNMYETSEYMRGVADSVRSSLAEAQALMTTSSAVAFEYQVQKWMGSLYSVGMNQSSVNNIASTIGKIAAGDLSALTSGGTGNLVMMAANSAGLSISDLLANGLTESSTNKLLATVVDYLANLYDTAKDSKVIQQQMAGVYGVTASDLRAAKNLSSSTTAVAKSSLNYNSAIGRLYDMAGTLGKRTSIGEMMENTFSNLKYSMAAGIANSPALYGTYKLAGMLNDVAGGIPIPFISAFGNGVDLETTVADLMLVGAMSGGILSSMGKLITAGSGGGISGQGMLNAVGLSKSGNATTVTRGSGAQAAVLSGASVSESGYIGNGSGDDVYNSTMSGANDSKKAAAAEAADPEAKELKDVDASIIKIFNLLDNMIKTGLNVKVSDYGLLTGANNPSM